MHHVDGRRREWDIMNDYTTRISSHWPQAHNGGRAKVNYWQHDKELVTVARASTIGAALHQRKENCLKKCRAHLQLLYSTAVQQLPLYSIRILSHVYCSTVHVTTVLTHSISIFDIAPKQCESERKVFTFSDLGKKIAIRRYCLVSSSRT